MTTPFDFINDLSNNKTDLVRSSDNPDNIINEYNAYMINRGFSYFVDTVLYANEMNKHADMDKIMQHDYYFKSVRKKKRFSKWNKKIEEPLVDLISEAYNINKIRAREYLALLDDEKIKIIKTILNKGGKQ